VSDGDRRIAHSADLLLDDRAYAAWSHVALDREVSDRSFGVKDVIDVAGMPTACGFEPFRDDPAEEDAAIVRRLRDAGWDPVGKTHTAQFAYADPPPTVSPVDAALTPGGSSTGSAVAVARDHVTLALGTQTGGSTIRPAAYCGVAAMKPTFGALPVEGIRPVALTLDTVGLICDSVGTIAAVARDVGLVTGDDAGGPRSGAAGLTSFDDVAPWIEDAATLEGWRTVMAALGQELSLGSGPLPDVDFTRVVELHVQLMAVQVWPAHAERHATEQARYYGPKFRTMLEQGRDLVATTSVADLEAPLREHLRGLEAAVRDDALLIMPATVGLPPARSSTGSSRLAMPWTVLGNPVVVVPWRFRLPDSTRVLGGVQIVGARDADASVIGTARTVEAVLRAAGLHPATSGA
jgi:Asp-tRNA(Asn)/Glu-tRNA(Gln) amidotransferase A subunit family amidase